MGLKGARLQRVAAVMSGVQVCMHSRSVLSTACCVAFYLSLYPDKLHLNLTLPGEIRG